MTMPRRQIVDVAVTRYYHCISRCVRRAFLCGEGVTHRKAWIEARLEVLAKHFAISVCGFAILDNHLHVLCRLDPGIADGLSDEDVVRRWIAVYRPSCLDVDSPATVQAWIDPASGTRLRLQNFSRSDCLTATPSQGVRFRSAAARPFPAAYFRPPAPRINTTQPFSCVRFLPLVRSPPILAPVVSLPA